MSDTTEYRPGDVANGHVLTEAMQWVPLPPPSPTSPAAIEAEVDRRTASSKLNAWLLWFFLGGIGAHLAYVFPKNRTVILIAGIAGVIFTFGLLGFAMWLFTWPFLLSEGMWRGFRDHVRREVEEDALRRHTLMNVNQ